MSDDLTLKIWREYLPGNPQGLVGGGSDPLWKCVCTVSGYHTRPIYDVDWYVGAISCSTCHIYIAVFGSEVVKDKREFKSRTGLG